MLLTGMPAVLQTPGKLGFVRQGTSPVKPRNRWRERFGQPGHAESQTSNRYDGSWEPFYYDSRQWHFDPTLKYQAPRPGSHAWYDETLTYQAERGPNQFGAAGGEGVSEMSTTTKAAIAIGASVLILGGAALVVKHTLLDQGF